MDEIKYAGYTAAELRDILDNCEQAGEGIDSVLGDGAIACNIISALLDAIEGA